FDYHDRGFVRSIAGWFHDRPLLQPGLHLPFEEDAGQGRKRPLPILHAERRIREQALDELKRCLELAERLPIGYVVLHLGAPREAFTPVKFDFAYSAIAAIQAFAGVHVLLENLPNEVATMDRLREFKAVAQLSETGICYDTGHGLLDLNAVEA